MHGGLRISKVSSSPQQIAVSLYPLTQTYKTRFETIAPGNVTYLTLSELRQSPLNVMLQRLWRLRPKVAWLIIEDAQTRCVLPILQLVVCLSRPADIQVVMPDFDVRKANWWHFAHSSLLFVVASIRSLANVATAWFDLRSLNMQPQINAKLDAGPLFYCKTSVTLGVKAGGSVGHIAGVVNEMAALGLHVIYFASEPPIGVDKAVRYKEVPTLEAFGFPIECNHYRHGLQFTREIISTGIRPAFIYQRMSLANYSGVAASRKLRVPLVLEYNGSEVWVQNHWGRPLKFKKVADLAEQVNLRHAHLMVTVSEVLRDELVERGVRPDRIVWYPNCVDPRVFDPARFPDTPSVRRQLGLPEQATLVTFLGTFGPWHGTDILARAIRKLVECDRAWLEKHQVHFVLVGDGQMMTVVREILGPEIIGHTCTLTGLVPQGDAPLYLAASDILLVTNVKNSDGTRFFGSPTKLFEYMAMAKGIVASDLEQIGDLLQPALRVEMLPDRPPRATDEQVVVMFEPGNISQLVQCVRFLVEQPAWRKTLGKNARKLVLAKYTWQQHVGLIMERLEELYGHPGSAPMRGTRPIPPVRAEE